MKADMGADTIDRSLTMLWAVLGAAVILRPTGYTGWTDLALWNAVAWLVVLVGMCYLRTTKGHA